MKKKILLISTIICLLIGMGLADKGLFPAAGLAVIWPVFVLVCNLIDSVRRYGW